MYLALLWLAVSSCVAAKGIQTDRTDFASVSVPEEERVHLQNESQRLENITKRNVDDGFQSLVNVVAKSGLTAGGDPFDEESLPESFLLRHQINLRRDMERMFKEMKDLLVGSITTHIRHKRDNAKLSKELNVSLLPSTKNIYSPTDISFRPEDCSEVLVGGQTKSGIYEIYPFRCQCSAPVKVMCDMDTDGGGWTIFLQRQNQSKQVNFTQNWEAYKRGFGSPGGEDWLGNEYLHLLSLSRNYVFRLEAKDGFGREIWGEWNTFYVDSEDMKYKITAENYNSKSTAKDRFSTTHSGMNFSTFDMDNDKHAKINCAVDRRGGWWYSNCAHYNPTGSFEGSGNKNLLIIPWSKQDSTQRNAKWIQLKIRPKICNELIPTAKLNTHNCVY